MSAETEPEQAGSLRSRAISEIRSRIQRQDLRPDHTFSEVSMCQELAMSRAPVREALIALTGGGWVEALPRAGWQVRAMTLNEVRDLLAVRAALLPAAAVAASRRAPHDDVVAAALRDCCAAEADNASAGGRADDQATSSSDDSVDRTVAAYRCQRRIIRMSGNFEFDRCLEDVLARLVRYYLLQPVAEALRSQPEPLRPLADAVLSGDNEAAHTTAADFCLRDQTRLTEAIIDSDLIRSVKISVPSSSSTASGRRALG